MISLGNKLFVEFAIQAPIREQNVNEIVDKYMAALVLEAITLRAVSTSFLSACSKVAINYIHQNWVLNNKEDENILY